MFEFLYNNCWAIVGLVVLVVLLIIWMFRENLEAVSGRPVFGIWPRANIKNDPSDRKSY